MNNDIYIAFVVVRLPLHTHISKPKPMPSIRIDILLFIIILHQVKTVSASLQIILTYTDRQFIQFTTLALVVDPLFPLFSLSRWRVSFI